MIARKATTMADSPEGWKRLEPILDAALDCPPGERAAVLERACAGDAALRADAERLLDACDQAAEGFLAQPAPEFAAPLLAGLAAEPPLPLGRATIGPYRVVGEAGRGGMGTVYLAERDDAQFRMQVALKLVRDGFGDVHRMRRFVDERQILASLQHPNIARLLDGGVTADGIPYFAMEYVQGLPIDRFCDEQRLGVEARLRLFCRVCGAVQYAHRNLVVHRDLKPSNLLVTAEGEPKLLDFGIAKLLGANEERGLTWTGVHPMTPEYASPEQLRGDPVSTASDIYSLGAILYLLLSGHLPYPRTGWRTGEADPRRLDPPERPSQAVLRPRGGAGDPAGAPLPAHVGQSRGTTPEKLSRRLRGDLDTIVLRALHPEPERRYATVGEMMDDVRRHLEGLPVGARPDTAGYRARKFVSRHRFGVATGAAVGLVLLAFSGVAAVQAARAAADRDRAERTAAFLVELFTVSDPSVARGHAVTAREILDRGAARVERELRDQPEVQARMQDAMGRAYFGLGLYDEARPLLEHALATRRRLHGPGHPEVASSLYQLAYLLRNTGDFEASEAMYRESLSIRRTRLAPDDPELLASINGLAYVLRGRGDFAAASTLYREALERGRHPFGQRHPEMVHSLYGLAASLRGLGDRAGAERTAREAAATSERLLGPDHPETTIALYTLAVVLQEAGRLAEAEPLFRRVIETERRVLGPEHPLMAVNLSGLAGLLFERGDLEGAERLYRDALAIQRAALPEGHERTATTLVGLGRVMVRQGRVEAAEPLLREALAARERALRPDHWMIAEAQSAWGESLSRLRRGAEAERLLRESYGALAASRPAGDPLISAARDALVGHYQRSGQAEAAARVRGPASAQTRPAG